MCAESVYSKTERKRNIINEKMMLTFELLADIEEWSRESTHALYSRMECSCACHDVKDEEYSGPSLDYLRSKAWELVALLDA